MNLNMQYYNIYYFCHIANESMGKLEYARNHAGFLDSHFSVEPEEYPKVSALWHYCMWLVDNVICEQADIMGNGDNRYDFDPFKWIQGAVLRYRNLDLSKTRLNIFFCRTEIEEPDVDYLYVLHIFIEELERNYDGLYYSIIRDIAYELEFILFQNRDFLLRFNKMISAKFDDNIRSRVYIPEWIKRAILFRDNGRCVFCKKDLSGLNSLLEDNEKHFDHMVPLDKGGLNDICNIQLSCKDCNLKKSTEAKTSTLYQTAY